MNHHPEGSTVNLEHRPSHLIVLALAVSAVLAACGGGSGALVVVRLRVTADNVTVAVLDRGPGVPPDRLDRIFERFYMADPSRRGGSGLGLAIAAENAALLGGELLARNRTGDGLEIQLVLPVTEPLPDGDRAATHDEQPERR